MTTLLRVLEFLRADQIDEKQTHFVDSALSIANHNDIPDTHVPDVINYINTQLLHNPVSQNVKEGLDRLQKELCSRRDRG